MLHLRNFCQVSIEEVRQEMTGSAVKSSALDRNSEGRRLKIGDNWSYAPPVKNFWLRHCISIMFAKIYACMTSNNLEQSLESNGTIEAL